MLQEDCSCQVLNGEHFPEKKKCGFIKMSALKGKTVRDASHLLCFILIQVRETTANKMPFFSHVPTLSNA